MARYLVTGGAGYIGSHVVKLLVESGHEVVVVDNLCQGHRAAVPPGVELIEADLADRAALDRIFSQRRFGAVFHVAALTLVGASMREPLRYARENFGNAMNVAEAAIAGGCLRLVVSSTASYLTPPDDGGPIADDAVADPQNPYAESKLMMDRMLRWAERAHGLHSASLRFFNAAGSDRDGQLGEDHDPETHLIPLVIDTALGRRPPLSVFGTDYPTRDGTAIRDYIHVSDLAAANLAVLEPLERGSCCYNVGNGIGVTVREIIASVERVSGRKVATIDAPRRAGDPAVLVGCSQRFRADTGWQPVFTRLDDLIETAWNWRLHHPQGYGV